jgi:hypothetical protein
MLVSLVGCGTEKQTSFVVDGENFSAQANDGELVLKLKIDTASETWANENESELFSIDYYTENDDFVEFHLNALNEGSGIMVLNHVKDDGSVEAYNLTLEISRQQKTNLKIDTISLVKVD